MIHATVVGGGGGGVGYYSGRVLGIHLVCGLSMCSDTCILE